MVAKSLSELTAVSLRRRDLLRIGAGAAALTALGLSGPAVAGEPPSDAELFAFSAPHDGALVFAVAFPVRHDDRRSPTPAVCLHAGQKSWSIASVESPAFISGNGEESIAFVGRCLRTTGARDRAYHLVALAVPRSAAPAGRLGIWAEIGDSDSRVRVGSPIVAELLRQDPALARIVHRVAPTQDPSLFGEAIAQRIATRGTQTPSPQAHGKRLAAMLLPDVLSFDPDLPVGYTFASQNGRRPSDPIGEVVATLLAGAVPARPLEKRVFRAAPAFPYFETLVPPDDQCWSRGSSFRGPCVGST